MIGISGPRHTGPFLDWLALSFQPEEKQEILKRKLQELISPDKLLPSTGGKGYRASYRSDDKTVSLAIDGGHEGMGAHLNLTGRACSRHETDLLPFTIWAFDHGAKVSRLDLAIDEPMGLLDLEEVIASIKAGGCVSKFKAAPRVEEFFDTQTGEVSGRVIRFGSRTSKVCIRFYDKAMQKGEDFHWLRVELELKSAVAHQVAEDWVAGVPLDELLFGILSTYLSFRLSSGGKNRSRWAVEPWWKNFLEQGPNSGFRIRSKSRKDDLDWFIRGYDKVVARAARQYGPHVFKEMIDSGEKKLLEQSL